MEIVTRPLDSLKSIDHLTRVLEYIAVVIRTRQTTFETDRWLPLCHPRHRQSECTTSCKLDCFQGKRQLP